MIVGEPNGLDMTRLMPKEVRFAELIMKGWVGWINDNVGLIDEEAKADLLKQYEDGRNILDHSFVMAGEDIHSDKGYEVGPDEGLKEFVKQRNKE